jgi:hypothetical protein
MKRFLNEGNQIHNFISSSGSGTVINYGSGSGSDFLTNYGSGSGSTSQKVTVPTVPVPVPIHCFLAVSRIRYSYIRRTKKWSKSFVLKACRFFLDLLGDLKSNKQIASLAESKILFWIRIQEKS